MAAAARGRLHKGAEAACIRVQRPPAESRGATGGGDGVQWAEGAERVRRGTEGSTQRHLSMEHLQGQHHRLTSSDVTLDPELTLTLTEF